ncbi:MAG: hypothetical protein GYB31_11945 [Bacteroidetes bacterium]|nr:hypothetical protein [Bacteroidota bacterium]
MKTPVSLLVLIIGLLVPTFGESQAAEIYTAGTHKSIGNYFDLNHKPVGEREFRLFFRFNFGGSSIRNPESVERMIPGIRQINLYYTDFPKGMDFSVLNTARIEALLEAYPALDSLDVDWVFYKQTDCNNQEDAINHYHGFEVIMDFDTDINLSEIAIDPGFDDFILNKVFERNDWTDMLVVTDLTGSMDPYIAQLFLWLKLNTTDKRVKHFIFFNDGDSELDKYKVIGQTGGIYSIRSGNYEKVELAAIRCMKSGYGGDVPENDVEALIEGIDECPNCKEVILIADNLSEVRDLELVKKLNRPVRVILCGANNGYVNPEYLNLARDTKGSVHLIEEDLHNLMEMNEGETLELFGKTYQIVNNRFVLIKST